MLVPVSVKLGVRRYEKDESTVMWWLMPDLTTSKFIQFGYWDAARDGLLAGERLYIGVKQLEAAYQEKRSYDYKVTKHVSLRQINPWR